MVRLPFNIVWIGVFIMNDFTKEELETLLETCYQWRGEYGAVIGESLINKLHSMIDNYRCKHERTSPPEVLNMPLHCLDCGEKFE